LRPSGGDQLSRDLLKMLGSLKLSFEPLLAVSHCRDGGFELAGSLPDVPA
jgi:hypothetical protein